MHDRFRRKHSEAGPDPRARRKIAAEAARRLYARIGPEAPGGRLAEAPEAEFYAAKRQAAAVLGFRVRPGDLPSDSEVRAEVVALARSGMPIVPEAAEQAPAPEAETARLGDHIGRFEVYRLRLEPLADVKQSPKRHPEGDALYHSLQVFELARGERPFDEDFLLAALLHDVGKAIDPDDPAAAGVEALAGAIDDRTAWLIAHLRDLAPRPGYSPSPKTLRDLKTSEYFEDLELLRDLDEGGRVPGAGGPEALGGPRLPPRPRPRSRGRFRYLTVPHPLRNGARTMTEMPTLFFDVGGVLLTNGWDTAGRKGAAEKFGIDYHTFQTRHEMLKTAFETGKMSLDSYVARTVFHRPRDFSPEEFKQAMYDSSKLLGDTLEWVRKLAATGKYRLFTLNNESRELHERRVENFGLGKIFRGFLTSCYLGQVKPDEGIYLNALGIAACPSDRAVFIDDRELNVEPATALGLNALHFVGLDDLRARLKEFGIEA